MKVISSRELNQDVSSAKRFARAEPVFITDRGRPTHVLLSIDAFRRLTGQNETMVDLLAMPDGTDADVEPVRAADAWGRGEVR